MLVGTVYKFHCHLVCIQAFEIARSLGIACTLTPNMMVTATIPDKLAVTSFVYQMYQYFTKATQSAITRQNSRNVGSGTNSPTGQLVIPIYLLLVLRARHLCAHLGDYAFYVVYWCS